MVLELVFFKRGVGVFPEEEEVVDETAQLVGLYLLYVHAAMDDHRFQQIQFLMLEVGVLDSEAQEVKGRRDSFAAQVDDLSHSVHVEGADGALDPPLAASAVQEYTFAIAF